MRRWVMLTLMFMVASNMALASNLTLGPQTILIITPVAPKPIYPDLTFKISQGALYGSVGADLLTTWRGMNHGAIEANPALGQSRLTQALVVGGSTIAFSLMTRYLYRHGHPRAATILNFTVTGVHGAAALSNSRQ